MEPASTLKGQITYINQKNKNATIEYLKGNKMKEVHTNLSDETQAQWLEAGLIRKSHHYLIGDEVRFELTLSARGDKQMATAVQYLGNTQLSNLLYKASQQNHFKGYLKQVEDQYFIKEADSYILFPLDLSPWERKPDADQTNELVDFSLTHIDKPARVQAVLKRQVFSKAYREAEKHFQQKKPILATIEKITPHGIYVHFFDGQMKGKVSATEAQVMSRQPGDSLEVEILFLSPKKMSLGLTS